MSKEAMEQVLETYGTLSKAFDDLAETIKKQGEDSAIKITPVSDITSNPTDDLASIPEYPEFHIAFCLDRLKVFEISYYTLGNNRFPYFATEAAIFAYSKAGYHNAGQCQPRVLTGKAKKFFEKWDKYHLKRLTKEQYEELREDIAKLKEAYPYFLEKFKWREEEGELRSWAFRAIRDLSMKVPKK